MNKLKILLFGTGSMAYEYAKVLRQMNLNFIVVGRGTHSAKVFEKNTGIIPFTGGAAKFLASSDYSSYKAIVAVTGDQLGSVTLDLIKYKIESILVEKPGGLDEKEIKLVKNCADKYLAKVYIAYNRRFYASTKKAKEIIDKDGGVLSFHYEFNEPEHKIALLEISNEIKQRWLLHNSSHVIDLAFFLCGQPKSINCKVYSSLSWHPNGAIFIGFGECQAGIPFTYHANWLAPGRWGLEVMTKNHRLIFRPMEKLHIQTNNSFEIKSVNLDDELDTKFKPGLFKEIESFLGNKHSLCTIEEQLEHLRWYAKILKER